MILGFLSEPYLCAGLRRAASAEEDVLLNDAVSAPVLAQVFPRLLVHDAAGRERASALRGGGEIPWLELHPALLRGWEEERQARGLLLGRADYLGRRLAPLLRPAGPPLWVDRLFGDLSRAAGAPLPGPFRGFARRILEHPARYDDLAGVGELAGLSRGALKARFRRRSLASPSLHVRWLRCLAAAHLLSDPSVTTLVASQRLGFTSDGNFCRAILTTTEAAPSALRSVQGRQRLVTTFAVRFLGPYALVGWETLDDLFVRRAA